MWFDVGIKRYTTLRRTLIMLSRLWLMSESRFLRLEKAYMPKAGWIFLLRKSNLPLAYHINCKDSARRAEKKHMVKKSNHQFVADNVWNLCPRFLPSSCPRYMALASEPERISLFWRVTGSCVALLLCLPAVFLITFLALWLTLPPLLSFSEMFCAVSS